MLVEFIRCRDEAITGNFDVRIDGEPVKGLAGKGKFDGRSTDEFRVLWEAVGAAVEKRCE